ncbi:MAG: hypothetical protein D6677_03025 [Calditrichaeota bacterium]|nr:MAG: hypothetical protein D6677_03025 [Calditrichota bacterium]
MENSLSDVFDDIILGRGVKRSVHDLIWRGRNRTALFAERLQAHGFMPIALKDAEVPPGIRIPGFLLEETGTAWFGYLFREFFTETRQRKIWGSVKRNEKGDWALILPGNSQHVVYLNTRQQQEIDIYHLTGM